MKPRKINSDDSKIHVFGFERRFMSLHDLRKAKHGMKKSRVFFFQAGEGILEDLVNRHFRPHNEYRKIMADILNELGLDKNMKFHWDTYAGCAMCPCSPGFVLEGDFNHNIFVDYAFPEAITMLDGFIQVNKKEEETKPKTFEGFIVNGQVTEEIDGLTVTTTKKQEVEIEVEGFELVAA